MSEIQTFVHKKIPAFIFFQKTQLFLYRYYNLRKDNKLKQIEEILFALKFASQLIVFPGPVTGILDCRISPIYTLDNVRNITF